MTRRNGGSLLRFGAVVAALLLAAPALADDIEPEPYVEEETAQPEPEPEPEPVDEAEVEPADEVVSSRTGVGKLDLVIDAAVLRPFNFVNIIVGGGFFIPAAVMAAPGGMQNIEDAWNVFVAPSIYRTFQAPLGQL